MEAHQFGSLPDGEWPKIRFDHERRVVAASPYRVTWDDLISAFGGAERRKRLARSFLGWYHELSRLVMVDTIWVGGSFFSKKKAPSDIDCVVFYRYRALEAEMSLRSEFIEANKAVLTSAGARQKFNVDCGLIPLNIDTSTLLRKVAFWSLVLSNGRNAMGRGFYEIDRASLLLAAVRSRDKMDLASESDPAPRG